MAVVATLAVAAALVTGVSFTALRFRPPVAARAMPSVPLAAPSPPATSDVVAEADPTPETSSTSAATPALPASTASAPPKVVAPRVYAATASVPLRWGALPAPPASTPATSPPRPTPKVDDGF